MSRGDGLLAQGERVLFETHKHPLFLALRLAVWVAVALVLVAVGIWVALTQSHVLAAAVWVVALVPAIVGIVRYLVWRGERYQVTNHRVMQISGVLGRRVFDSSLEQVNDILLTQSLFGRMLGFGDLEIITGSDIGLNVLKGIAHPVEFKRTIVEAQNTLDDARAGRPADNLVQLLAALNELRDSGVLTPAEYEAKRRDLVSGASGQSGL